MRIALPLLDDDPDSLFPAPESALREPDGLLAIGGDLSPKRLLGAYRRGIFPWYSDGQPILWWSPDPRMVFRSDGVRLSSRFRRGLKRSDWTVRADTAFDAVIDACARIPRPEQRGSWITGDMQAAYRDLHRLGHAHSIEVYAGGKPDEGRLAGGLYGVAIGRMFFAESMFSGVSGGSKVALAALAQRLAQWQWPLIDAQVENAHLATLGAESWPRSAFLREIGPLCAAPEPVDAWTRRFGEVRASELAT